MYLVSLTPENAKYYIGCSILFKSRGNYIIKKIISVSNTSVKIEHPDLNNSLTFKRNIKVILDNETNNIFKIRKILSYEL
jgi:hypothetical protein